jgi:lipoate-protein ligase B
LHTRYATTTACHFITTPDLTMNFTVEDLGLIEYQTAWRLQEQYAAEIAQGKRPPTLLLLEHPHVYTSGRRGKMEHLLWSDTQLREKGIAVHWVDRGGDVTYHGPGQLVGYPLFLITPPLPHQQAGSGHIPQADYVGYLRALEKALIIALANLGVAAGQRTGLTGVWVQADVHSRCLRCKAEERQKPAKIAAIGVKVDSRGVTRHGFALNVNPQMEYWEGIIACGLQDEPLVSLADLFLEPPSMARVKEEVIKAFTEVFA